MSNPSSNFSLSILFAGTLSILVGSACTSGQSLRNDKPTGSGGALAGSGGSSHAGGAGGSGGTGGTTYHTDYNCNGVPSGYPCGGTTGAGGTQGMGGTVGRDAAVEAGSPDAPVLEANPDLGATEAATVVLDVARIDPLGIDSAGIDSDGILRGYQVYGNELMAFEPCGSSELIWMNLSGNEKGLGLIPAQTCPGDASLAMCVRHMYTELLGAVSPPGKYGHLSKYAREIRVQEFLVVTLAESQACPFVTPVYPN